MALVKGGEVMWDGRQMDVYPDGSVDSRDSRGTGMTSSGPARISLRR
jgi:hypothetical protein